MPKLIMEDVHPPSGRSIRDVPLKAGGRTTDDVKEVDAPSRRYVTRHMRVRMRMPRARTLYTAAAVAGAILLYFMFSAMFAGATITVTPRTARYTLDHEFKSQKSAGGAVLSHEVLTLTKDAEEKLAATGERYIEKKASGRIVIFNASTAASQRLIKNTRFETDKGLIFRIDESIVVPGKAGTGQNEKPGSVEVTVYADGAGPEYNIGLSDFTIPGFKSDPDKYKNIFARSKTIMTGGSKGVRKIVEETAVVEAKKRLEAQLRSDLATQARVEVPESFVLYDAMATVSYEDLPESEADGGSMILKRRGTLTAPIFAREKLSKSIAAAVEDDYDGRAVLVPEASSLAISSLPGGEQDETIRFKLSGPITLVSTFDESALRLAFIGRPRSAVHTIRSEFPAILSIEAVIRPFWKRSFPEALEDIKLVKVLAQ